MIKVFELTNKYMVLATPLILFSLISNLYVAISSQGRIINLLIAIVLLLLMTSAFIAGWFSMVKNAIIQPEREDTNSLMKNFIPGVGEYFVPSVVVVINAFVILGLFLLIAYCVGMKFIGDIGISSESFSKAMESTPALKAFLLSLTKEQIIKMNQWNLLLLGTMVLSNFIIIFYLPVVFFKERNPFKALFLSVADLFKKKFITTFGIGVLIFVIYFVISILMAMFAGNIILHFLVTLANFYFIMLVSVGIFYYYYHNFVKSLGQNVDVEV